jgi:hypothetical protein
VKERGREGERERGREEKSEFVQSFCLQYSFPEFGESRRWMQNNLTQAPKMLFGTRVQINQRDTPDPRYTEMKRR